MNTLGQQVYTEEISNVSSDRKSLNIQNWPDGMYMIAIENQFNHLTRRIVKE
jgi:hypothetical protein